jgi:hypothetical protein
MTATSANGGGVSMRGSKSSFTPIALAVIALTVSIVGAGFAFGRTGGREQVMAPVTWHQLTLRNGWGYGENDSYHAAWYKDAGGIVHLRGSLAGGSPVDMAFRLPIAARPNRTLWLQVYAFNGSAGGLQVLPTGRAYAFDDSAGPGVTGYTSLDGVSFWVP